MSKTTRPPKDALKRKTPPKADKPIFVEVPIMVPVGLLDYLRLNYEEPLLAANEIFSRAVRALIKTGKEVSA